ncbi:MAG: hypothetical protein ABI325_07305 [Ginsengibacter sp.]
MNDHLENITPLAEKLQQVTLPHVDESWQAMKTLLNKEMPVAQNKHRKRWLLLIILLLLFIGLCNSPAVLKWSRLTEKNDTTVSYIAPFNKKEATPKTMPSLNSEGDSVKISGYKKTVSDDSIRMINDRKQKIDKNEPLNYSRNIKIQTQKIYQVSESGISMMQTSDSAHKITYVEERNEKRNIETKKRNEKKSNDLLTGKNEIMGQDLFMNDSNLPLTKNKTEVVSEDSIERIDKAGNSNSKKDEQTVEINTQHPVAKKITESDSTEDEKGFLFAVGFNQFFPVGHQKKIDFNSNGRSNSIGDYIPVPVARYYFHKWLYVQAEAQFNAPQYTKSLLASNSVSINSSGQGTSKSVFIKKLFYFNLPLSVHYSPVKNLYFGAGIQYSMLTSGVALFENSKSPTLGTQALPANDPLLISSKIGNLKKAPAYSALRTNEFRFLFDVNYQWEPFTIGVRYNQAFTNFINVHISNNIITQARNSSLQLYLRFTIWDHRKKDLLSK